MDPGCQQWLFSLFPSATRKPRTSWLWPRCWPQRTSSWEETKPEKAASSPGPGSSASTCWSEFWGSDRFIHTAFPSISFWESILEVRVSGVWSFLLNHHEKATWWGKKSTSKFFDTSVLWKHCSTRNWWLVWFQITWLTSLLVLFVSASMWNWTAGTFWRPTTTTGRSPSSWTTAGLLPWSAWTRQHRQ